MEAYSRVIKEEADEIDSICRPDAFDNHGVDESLIDKSKAWWEYVDSDDEFIERETAKGDRYDWK